MASLNSLTIMGQAVRRATASTCTHLSGSVDTDILIENYRYLPPTQTPSYDAQHAARFTNHQLVFSVFTAIILKPNKLNLT